MIAIHHNREVEPGVQEGRAYHVLHAAHIKSTLLVQNGASHSQLTQAAASQVLQNAELYEAVDYGATISRRTVVFKIEHRYREFVCLYNDVKTVMPRRLIFLNVNIETL